MSGLRELPPMPSAVRLYATVRLGPGVEMPVAEIEFVDVLGDVRLIHLAPTEAVTLMVELAKFTQQLVKPQ